MPLQLTIRPPSTARRSGPSLPSIQMTYRWAPPVVTLTAWYGVIRQGCLTRRGTRYAAARLAGGAIRSEEAVRRPSPSAPRRHGRWAGRTLVAPGAEGPASPTGRGPEAASTG